MASADQLATARDRVKKCLDDGPQDRLVAVVVGSIDLRATIDARVKGLSSPADQAHLFAWREVADTLLVGGRTLTIERYGSLLPKDLQDARIKRDEPPIPPVATISRRATLDVAQIRRAKEPPDLTVYSQTTAPGAVDAEWVTQPAVTAESVVEDLRGRGNRIIVSEGGPTLFGLLFEAGVVTDLSLTVAPLLVGDEGPRVVEPAAPGPKLRLAGADATGGSLFTHYVV